MNGIGRKNDACGYLQDRPSPPASGGLKRARSQDDPFTYDPMPSGDDGDQPKEDINRAKSYVPPLFSDILISLVHENVEH